MYCGFSFRTIGLLLLVVFGGRCFSQERCFSQDGSAEDLPRIRVSGDKKSFVLGASDKRFVPWGFNYLGQFEHLAEEEWETDEGWKRIENDFAQMKKLGANVVRWHLQFETYMEGPEKVKAESLARLKKVLGVARAAGLYLDLTGLGCHRLKRSPAWYDVLSEEERWKAQARFWDAIAETCAGDSSAGDSVVFCYDLMNEPVITESKEGEHRWLTGELGGFHFVQRISHKPAGRDSKEIAEAWVKSLVEPIRRRDQETLVTVGVIPWAFVWPNAKPIFYSPEVAKHLDFASIHVYPKSGELEKELKALAVYDVGMPLVIEEIFPMTCSTKELDAFIDAASPRVDGWVAHYFGFTAAEHRNEGTIAGAMKGEFLEYWGRKGREMSEPK
jgi:Cellulase (glycosyl hydrolase family 5)